MLVNQEGRCGADLRAVVEQDGGLAVARQGDLGVDGARPVILSFLISVAKDK